jgi:hypothetical protein
MVKLRITDAFDKILRFLAGRLPNRLTTMIVRKPAATPHTPAEVD